MQHPDVAASLRSGSLRPDSLAPAGGGDYCDVRDAGKDWLLLVARTDEASCSLARTSALLSGIIPRVSLMIPEPGATGLLPDGRRFLLLRRVPGVPLTRGLLAAMTSDQQDAAARAIGSFLGVMHATPVELAATAGVPTAWYPFAATEDGMSDGPAAPYYAEDLDGLARSSFVDSATLDRLAKLVTAQLERRVAGPALLHGEVSADHVFVDPATLRVTGIIDFQGVVLGDPVRDLLYLADSYGLTFVEAVLRYYPGDAMPDLLPALAFYRVWHQVVRLLWAAEHGYAERATMLGERVGTLTGDAGR